MALAICDGQRETTIAIPSCDSEGGRRIEAAAEQDDGGRGGRSHAVVSHGECTDSNFTDRRCRTISRIHGINSLGVLGYNPALRQSYKPSGVTLNAVPAFVPICVRQPEVVEQSRIRQSLRAGDDS